jgi:hypothetical protein
MARYLAEPLEARRLLAAMVSGQRLTGTIGSAGAIDTHTFEAAAHDAIAVVVGDTSGTGFFPQIQVRAPDSTVLDTSSGQAGAGIDLPNVVQSGTYTISVTGASSTTGNYALSMFRAPSTQIVDADSGPITSGQRVTGTIDLGDLDVYTFTGNAHESIALALGDTGVTGFFPQMQVFAPNGLPLGTASGQTGAGLDLLNLPQSGTYAAVIRHAGDTFNGPYALTMFRAPAAQPVDADSGPITSGQRVTGTIDPGDIDIYTFTASAFDAVALAVGDTGNTGFIPHLQLYAPNGALLKEIIGQTGGGLDFPALSQTGTYYAVVRHAGDSFVGSYGLTMVRAPAAQVVDADSGPITSGQRVTGTIEFGDIDVYTFTAAANDAVAIALGDPGESPYFPFFQLIGPTGKLLASGSGQTGAGQGLLNVQHAGTHTILVHHAGDDFIGSYALTMVRAPASQVVDADSGPITSGQRALGAIDYGDIDIYTFSASAGDSLALAVGDIGQTAFFPQIQLIAPDGSFLSGNSGQTGAGLDAQNLPLTGTYYAVVRHAGDTFFGHYALTMFRSPSAKAVDADSGALVSSQRRLGTIDFGDIDVYTFTATAGSAFSVTLADADNTAFFPQLQVYAPDGALLYSVGDQISTAFDALNVPTTGTYYAIVRHAGDTFFGRYVIDLARVPATQLIDPLDNDGGQIATGQSRSGAISLADLDVYTFDLLEGANASIQLSRLAGTSYNPRLDIFDPTGQRLASQVGTLTTTVNLTNVRLAGTYYAVARESGDDAVGNYSVGLDIAPAADTRAPLVTNTRFDYDTPRQQVVFTMSESIGASFAIADLTLTNLDTAAAVPALNLLGAFNAASNEIIIQFTGFPFLALPDGNYRATLNAGSVLDTASIPLGSAVSFDFYVLAGDANRDRKVDVADLGVLASNWQRPGKTFSQGNFDYSATGLVDVADLGILASNWQKNVAAPSAPFAPAQRAATRATRLIDQVSL